MRTPRLVHEVAAARPVVHSRRHRSRSGAVLVWFALLLIVLLGMVGLVIDAGLLMATQRQAQNAADAAALAAAYDRMNGQSMSAARATAVTFVKDYNGLSTAPDPAVNSPPATGAYSGSPGTGGTPYVEVIVTAPMQTFFIHLLPGVAQDQTVRARAVAGYERVVAGEGVATLNPGGSPGLKVVGNSGLIVNGRVIDNSEAGVAADVANNATAKASEFDIVGGVNNPANFQNIDPGGPPHPVYTNHLPFPDPFLELATPMSTNGVDPTLRGSPEATNGNLKPNDPSNWNYVYTNPTTHEQTMVLYPGIYDSISITGGNVYFVPGIFVLAAKKNNQDVLSITGGSVSAQGVMIYNTGGNYSPNGGTPDATDGANSPPAGDNATFGSVKINNTGSVSISPIDTSKYNYLSPPNPYQPPKTYTGANVSPNFDGMVFYQRRLNDQNFQIEGSGAPGFLSGTVYAKWSDTKIAGQGTYDAQFIVGTMTVDGGGNVTINYAGKKLGKAPAVFLVE